MATVIVLGTDSPIGLSVIRDLGRGGFRVVGLGSHPSSLGLMSRYCDRPLVRAGTPDALVAQLIAIAGEENQAFLISIGESDINFVNRHRATLSPHLSLLDPEAEQMNKVLDKGRTIAAAREVGILTPESHSIGNLQDLDTLVATLDFPVVLKWANPHDVYHGLEEHGLEYCRDISELRAALSKYQALGSFPLVQEYCPGYGLGQFFLCDRGESVLEFQHQRINEWPPEGGSSTLCKGLPAGSHTTCMEQSRRLLRALNWHGVAMVEYRYDPEKDQYWLMEINGRFWGSLPLATRSRVGFASNLVRVVGQGDAPVPTPQRTGQKSRYMIPEIKRLFRILFQPDLIEDPFVKFSRVRETAEFLGWFLDPRCGFYVFEWNDPRPFVSDMRNAAGKLLGRSGSDGR